MKNIVYNKKIVTTSTIVIVPEILKMIGAELRRRRVRSGRILADYKQFCSCHQSYLSKIETGTIIPKYDNLRDYCSANGISERELETMLRIDELLDQIIYDYVNGKKDAIEETVTSIKSFDNYKTLLLNSFYHLINDDIESVKKVIHSVEMVYKELSVKDQNILNYLKMYVCRDKGAYFTAQGIYRKYSPCDNEALNALIEQQYLICLYRGGTYNPLEINSKTQEKFQFFGHLISDEVRDAFNYSLVLSKAEIDKNIVRNFKMQYQILYAYSHKDYEELERLEGVVENKKDQLLLACFLNKTNKANALFKDVKEDLYNQEFTKYEFLVDSISTRHLTFVNKIRDYYVTRIIWVEEGAFLDYFLEATKKASEATSRYHVFTKAYNRVREIVNRRNG